MVTPSMLIPAELISIRLALGQTQTGIAQLLHLGPDGGRMVRWFESGREIPPGPVLLLYALACDSGLPEVAIDGESTRNDTRAIARQIEDAERRLNMALEEAKTAEAQRDAALTATSVAEKRRQTAHQTVERMTEAFTAAVGLIADGIAWPRDKPGEWPEGPDPRSNGTGGSIFRAVTVQALPGWWSGLHFSALRRQLWSPRNGWSRIRRRSDVDGRFRRFSERKNGEIASDAHRGPVEADPGFGYVKGHRTAVLRILERLGQSNSGAMD